MKGKFIQFGRSVISLILCFALFATGIQLPALAETAGATPMLVSGVKTWQDAAEYVCGLLGEYPGNALNALKEWNYLEADVAPQDEVSAEQMQTLLSRVFGAVIDGDESLSADRRLENPNLYVTGQAEQIGSLTAKRLVFADGARAEINAVNADKLPITGAAELALSGTEIETVVIDTDQDVTLRGDSETKIGEVLIRRGGSVALEGSMALGVVHVQGEARKLTVRATCTIQNETKSAITVADPDGEERSIGPGTDDVLVLSRYVVSFVTEGTPVEPLTVLPGGIIDFSAIETTCEGKVFTAWYEDADYTVPCSTLMLVDRQMTLYARFVDPDDCVTVTFDTMGGTELAPLVFAKGEYLLSKPVDQIYTSMDGSAFCGWFLDEACEQSFGYTDPITQDMTLYAMFNPDEAEEETRQSNAAELNDADWLSAIEIVAPEDMDAQSVEKLISFEAGSGVTEPAVRMERTGDGFALYGDAYEQDGQRGFEPGSSFTIVLGEGLRFMDYDETVDTLLVSVYREQVETVIFRDDIQYLLWDDMASLELVTENEDGENVPGTLLYTGDSSFETDEIVCFYDGSIDPDEKNIDRWTEGSFDGYVMFIQVVSSEAADDGLAIRFLNANPVDYMADLDVNTTRKVDLEEVLDEEDIEQIERAVSAQIRGNDELRAQMLVTVMTSQDTQDKLDALYGEGTYALTAMTAKPGKVEVSPVISVSGNSVTAGVTVSLTVTLSDGAKTVMTVTPSMSFTEKVEVDVDVKAGGIWIDASLRLASTTRVKLEVAVASGDGEADFSEALETLENLVRPDGLEGDYQQAVDGIMQTMQSIVETELSYVDLFEVPLLVIIVDFYGIVALTAELDLVGQIGVLATFGMELVVEGGQKVGFKYDFKKMEGGSYKEKLKTRVENHVYLVGKIGVRVGLRLKLGVTLCVIAKAQIVGSIMAYAELTGMFFLNTSLLSGNSSYVGALYFEVGLDASVDLSLKADFILFSIGTSWNIWSERWPLYSTSVSSRLRYMDEEPLRAQWEQQVLLADHRASFGFATIPMRDYRLMDGSCRTTQTLPQAEDSKITLSIRNMTVNGELLAADDPRNALFEFGRLEEDRLPGYIYLNEKIAAEYGCETVELDLAVSYLDDSPSALVKKQELEFHLSRQCTLSTTTVDMKVMLYDECAHLWGLENARWDGEIVHEESFSATHMVGGLFEPTATAEVDLSGIRQKAFTKAAGLKDGTIGWAGVQGGLIQYSNPKVSAFCYLSLDNDTLRYDVRPETEEYGLTFYLYARRFEINPEDPTDSTVTYVLRYSGDPTTRFYTTGTENGERLYFTASEDGTWTLKASRAAFDGSAREIMMALESGEEIAAGLSVTGREYSRRNTLDLNDSAYALAVVPGEGIESFEATSPEGLDLRSIAPGTRVELDIVCDETHRNVLPVFEALTTISYSMTDNHLSFVMPAMDVTLMLSASRLHTVQWLYNVPGFDIYKTEEVAENETIRRPGDPAIEGLTFRGWYADEACTVPYEFETAPTQAVSVYADWTVDVTVDFCGPSGRALFRLSEFETKPVFEGDTEEDVYARFTFSTLRMDGKMPEIVLPNHPGHAFMGWYTSADFSGEAVNFDTLTLKRGLKLYALWAKVINVDYYVNHDGIAESYYTGTELKGYPLMDVPENPARAHYSFAGWYTSAACTPNTAFDPASDRLEADAKLYAGWKPVEYAIRYDLGGGENNAANPAAYTVESADIKLASPTRTGYEFIGWTVGEDGERTPEMVIAHGSSGDLSLTAHWEPVVYTIAYNVRHGEASSENPTTYTIESGDIALTAPKSYNDSYIFVGWIGEGVTEPAIDLTIPAGSTGDRVYTAQWQTQDPAAQILMGALDSIPDAMTVPLEDFSEGGGEPTIARLVDEAIRGGASGDYMDALKHTETLAGEPVETDLVYVYTYNVKVAYTDDDGQTIEDEITVTLTVTKKIPVLTAPTAARLLYGQSLAESELTGGAAMDGETAVDGTFAWVDSTLVPKGRENGSVLYDVAFTPDAENSAIYAPAQISIPVYTQTKLKVSITAEDRVYMPGDVSATGSYQLCDADDESIAIDGVVLAGGEYAFADENAGADKTVVFSGYALSAEDSADYVLGNTAASALAAIAKAEPTVTITQAPALTYQDSLRDHSVDGQGEWNGTIVPGTMQWVFDAEHPDTVTAAGDGEYKLEFVPDDTANYVSVIVTPTFTAGKREIAKPEIPAQTYTGRLLQAAVAQSSHYTVTDDSYTDAGTHYVTLTLTDADNTRWPDGDAAATTVPFVINRARLTRTGTLTLGNIAYGQKFLTGVTHTSAMGEGKVANEAIIGPVMKIDGGETVVTGNWEWLEKSGVTDVWCNAGTYELTARFTPTSVSADNYEPYEETFTVTVEKSTPTVAGTLTSTLNQTDGTARLPLALAKINSNSAAARNPNAAFAGANGNVQGTWAWEDEKVIPTESGKAYNVKFIPSDSRNYNQALYSATVTLTLFDSVYVQCGTANGTTGTGFSTGASYRYVSYGSYEIDSRSSANFNMWITGSTASLGPKFLHSTNSNYKSCMPLGVFVNGEFAINEGDGFTKVISGTHFFCNGDFTALGFQNEANGDYCTVNVEWPNGAPETLELIFNLNKMIPLSKLTCYYVGGLSTVAGDYSKMGYRLTVNGKTYDKEPGSDTINVSSLRNAVAMAAEPTIEPTLEPTLEPTTEPTAEPTAEPTTEPTTEPTAEPTTEPTAEQTAEPTPKTTTESTTEPTAESTAAVTAAPVVEPTSSQDAPPAPAEEGDSEGE